MEKTMNTKKNAPKNSRKKTPGRGLGRGLGSLLGVSNDEPLEKKLNQKPTVERKQENTPVSDERKIDLKAPVRKISDEELIHKVSIEQLSPNEEQPRKHFSSEALTDLTNSIKSNGIMQPIVAKRLSSDSFEIIAGERRWRAAQAAGLKTVPVILKKVDDQVKLELAIIENIQRDNLNPVEEGEAYSLLAKKYKLTQKEIAEKVGKDRATIANLMRITQLSKTVKEMVVEGKLSLGHAKVLLAVETPAMQKDLALKVTRLNLSVRATESMIKNALDPESDKKQKTHKDPHMKDLEDQLRKRFGTKIKIDESEGKGKIEIKFHSISQMNDLIDKLM